MNDRLIIHLIIRCSFYNNLFLFLIEHPFTPPMPNPVFRTRELRRAHRPFIVGGQNRSTTMAFPCYFKVSKHFIHFIYCNQIQKNSYELKRGWSQRVLNNPEEVITLCLLQLPHLLGRCRCRRPETDVLGLCMFYSIVNEKFLPCQALSQHYLYSILTFTCKYQ